MATRRAPLDLPLGQTLSGQQVAPQPVVPPESRQGQVLADLHESRAEARRSADLADMQRRLAEEAEEHRQRTLRAARERETQRRLEAEQRRLEAEANTLARRLARERADAEAAARGRIAARVEESAGQRRETLDATPEREHHLVTLAGVLQRTIDTLQRQLADLNQDLAAVREKLVQKSPAPSGYEDPPFREGERHLDLGEPEK